MRSLTLAKHPGSIGQKKKKKERQFVRKDFEINNKLRGGRRVERVSVGGSWGGGGQGSISLYCVRATDLVGGGGWSSTLLDDASGGSCHGAD